MTSAEATRTSLVDLACLRQATYRLFGLPFHHPGDDHLAELTAAAHDLARRDELAREFPFYRSWRDVVDFLAQLPRESRQRLREEYVDLFQVATSHSPCPLYESAYMDRTGRLAGWIASQVEQSYAAGGLTLSSAGERELPDHAGLELEFMSLLCGGEAQARENGAVDEAAESLALQRTFLEQHLRRWFPRLADRVRHVAGQTSFYRQLTDATLAFVIHDADLVEALVEEHPASGGSGDGGGR